MPVDASMSIRRVNISGRRKCESLEWAKFVQCFFSFFFMYAVKCGSTRENNVVGVEFLFCMMLIIDITL